MPDKSSSFFDFLYKEGNTLFDILRDKILVIILFIITTIFLGLAIYYYRTIVQPKLNKKYVDNNEFVSLGQTDDSEDDSDNIIPKNATLYFFYTNWCPHCKKAQPEWLKLKDTTQGSVKGINIVFKEIDCDKDTNLADKFKVNGYPTIKLVYDNKIYDYDAKPDEDTLIQFLNSVL
jgi:thiol-disulfide isomerase/thioredoxin